MCVLPARLQRFVLLFSLVAGSVAAHAQSPLRQDVTAIPVSRSFNLIGAGAGFLPVFSGANDYRAMVLPVVRLTWRDRLYWNALQGGAWLWDADDKSVRIGLAVEPRFGWDPEDGTRVAGMQGRDFSFDGGPVVQWRTAAGVFTASVYRDLGRASGGHTAQLQYVKALAARGPFRLNGLLGLQWFDRRSNDYYFGVQPAEARPGRPVFEARSSTSVQFGVNGSYSLTERGSLLFGAIGSRLGGGAADSPIVETSVQAIAYVGYGWSF